MTKNRRWSIGRLNANIVCIQSNFNGINENVLIMYERAIKPKGIHKIILYDPDLPMKMV